MRRTRANRTLGRQKKETQTLRAQTKQMESQLFQLQKRIAEEQSKRPGAGSSLRWKSASKSKGPITNYAKSFRRRKKEGKKRNHKNRVTKRVGCNASKPTEWKVEGVSDWLTSIGVPQYRAIFEANMITGQVLIEMNEEDLDFLNISFPAHRRMILNGIQDLKKGEKDSAHPLGQIKQNSSTRIVHWTEAAFKAQEDAKRHPRSHESPLVNSADDLGQGEYDEAAQRKAFQEAVMAWRRGHSTMSPEPTREAVGGMWTNPFGDMSDAVRETSSPHEMQSAGGGSLLNGTYDEDAQRKAFQDAVMAWRRSNSVSSPSPRRTAATASSTTPASKKGVSPAENLEKLQSEMDRDHAERMKKLRSDRANQMGIAKQRDASLSAIRETQKRIHELRACRERESTAQPLPYDVWDIDIDF